MISLKKAIWALGFGIGLGTSLNAWAIQPDCNVCASWFQQCQAGSSLSCARYDSMNCAFNFPDCTEN